MRRLRLTLGRIAAFRWKAEPNTLSYADRAALCCIGTEPPPSRRTGLFPPNRLRTRLQFLNVVTGQGPRFRPADPATQGHDHGTS